MNSDRLYKMLYWILTDYPGKMGGNLLGVYYTEAGEELPAIWKGNPPNTFQPGGLECNVPLLPDGPSTWTGHSIYTKQTWDVTLTEHSEETNYIEMAIARLKRFFPNSSAIFTHATEISLPQLRFSIYHECRANAVTFGINRTIFQEIK
ncbi:MAG: hypothetical protein ACRC4J_00090 [Cetobacterium sp.]